MQSGDQPPNGTVSGAIQTIAISPVNSSTMFVGATNGGIWTTRNGGSSWQPLTDNKISMSISSVAFDPTDASAQKLIAGVGATSNGSIGDAKGGQLTGIMYSNNGGANSTDLAGSGNTLSAQEHRLGRGARRQLAGGGERRHRQGRRALLQPQRRQHFFPGVGAGSSSVFGLAADNSSSNAGGNGTRFFASLSRAATPAANGVYLGDPTKPATWAQVLSLGAHRVAKVSTGPGGSVVAAVYDSSSGNPTSGKLVGIYLSQNSGATWASMTTNLPDTNPGGQASTILRSPSTRPTRTSFTSPVTRRGRGWRQCRPFASR